MDMPDMTMLPGVIVTLQDLMALAWGLLHDLVMLAAHLVGIPEWWLALLG